MMSLSRKSFLRSLFFAPFVAKGIASAIAAKSVEPVRSFPVTRMTMHPTQHRDENGYMLGIAAEPLKPNRFVRVGTDGRLYMVPVYT